VIQQIRCARLIGRAAELEFLRERCNDARLGHGSLVFINGEAGIGKTRLVDETIRLAKLTMHHAKGFCLEHARSPLGPLADIVRTLNTADESVLALARNVRRVLARLVPELEIGQPGAEAKGARSQYAAIAEMLRRCGARRPALLVIEDAHWADVSTAEFLKYYAGRVSESNVVLLVVSRTNVAAATRFAPVIADLRRRRSVHALDIEPLGPAEMQSFALAALGAGRLPHDDLHAICELADGVIGRRFDPAFLARLTKRPLERILLALRRARALQLVVESAGEDAAGVVFRHALVRETLYASILAAEARGMHRRILRELEALPDRAQHVAALAYHSWAAAEPETALTYNEIAADDAMARLATNEAAIAYERALSCSNQTERRRVELQRKLGAAFSASGWSSCAIDMYERAYAYAVRDGSRESIADICAALGREYLQRGDGDATLRWRLTGLEAVEAVPYGPVRDATHASLALTYAWRGDAAKAAEIIRRAGALGAAASPAAHQDLHDAKAALDLIAGRSGEALTRYRRAADDAAATQNTTLAVRVLQLCRHGTHRRRPGSRRPGGGRSAAFGR
jgi:predicted ATPase